MTAKILSLPGCQIHEKPDVEGIEENPCYTLLDDLKLVMQKQGASGIAVVFFDGVGECMMDEAYSEPGVNPLTMYGAIMHMAAESRNSNIMTGEKMNVLSLLGVEDEPAS